MFVFRCFRLYKSICNLHCKKQNKKLFDVHAVIAFLMHQQTLLEIKDIRDGKCRLLEDQCRLVPNPLQTNVKDRNKESIPVHLGRDIPNLTSNRRNVIIFPQIGCKYFCKCCFKLKGFSCLHLTIERVNRLSSQSLALCTLLRD